MSNDYVTSILVHQRLSELQHEAAVERLAREARQGRPRRRWWERLMLFRTTSTAVATPALAAVSAGPGPSSSVPTAVTPGRSRAVPAAIVAAGDSPC